MLAAILDFVYDDSSVHQNVAEEEEDPWLGFFSAFFGQYSFTHKDSSWDGKGLASCTKTCLYGPYSLSVDLCIGKVVHHVSAATDGGEEEEEEEEGFLSVIQCFSSQMTPHRRL